MIRLTLSTERISYILWSLRGFRTSDLVIGIAGRWIYECFERVPAMRAQRSVGRHCAGLALSASPHKTVAWTGVDDFPPFPAVLAGLGIGEGDHCARFGPGTEM